MCTGTFIRFHKCNINTLACGALKFLFSVVLLKIAWQMVLESSSDIFSLRFNPVKPHLIAGGCYNGQVWNTVTPFMSPSLLLLYLLSFNKSSSWHHSRSLVFMFQLCAIEWRRVFHMCSTHSLKTSLPACMQVILWDITKTQEKQDRKDRREAEESSEDKEKKKSVTMTPVVLFTLLSTMKTSHKAIVSDIHWLPKDFQV